MQVVAENSSLFSIMDKVGSDMADHLFITNSLCVNGVSAL